VLEQAGGRVAGSAGIMMRLDKMRQAKRLPTAGIMTAAPARIANV